MFYIHCAICFITLVSTSVVLLNLPVQWSVFSLLLGNQGGMGSSYYGGGGGGGSRGSMNGLGGGWGM